MSDVSREQPLPHLDLSQPVELLVLGVRRRAARCRPLSSHVALTFRSSAVGDVIPGEILCVDGRKQWRHAGHPYLSGTVRSRRVDLDDAGIEPLQLATFGDWDPDNHYWGEPDAPLDDWAIPLIQRGVRTAYELENVLPGYDPLSWADGPILRSIDLQQAGDHEGSRRLLMDLLIEDLRCLDAFAHLGNLVFDHWPERACRLYEMGVRIGDQALDEVADPVLPWGLVDNRPFLRCLHGFGLTLWRLGRTDEAAHVFERMLWLNPTDNQGARFLRADLRDGAPFPD